MLLSSKSARQQKMISTITIWETFERKLTKKFEIAPTLQDWTTHTRDFCECMLAFQ